MADRYLSSIPILKTLFLILQVSIAVSRTLFGDVNYNGTIFVDDMFDNDWVIMFISFNVIDNVYW